MGPQRQCTMPGCTRDQQRLRELVRELEDELSRHDPDEGHEWPQPEDDPPRPEP